jgi:Na+-translocating ferredoxin:NAD+ oxidoreductase RNF subunit RnfB
MGIVDMYREAIARNQAKIQLLIPQGETTEKLIANLKAKVPELSVRSSTLQTNISIMTANI